MTRPATARISQTHANRDVPETLRQAVYVFLTQPTVIGVTAGLLCLGLYRLTSPFTSTDALVAVAIVCVWLVQEWSLHKFLLHSNLQWFGRQLHEEHHRMPYYHICVDSPVLVFSTMLISAIILKMCSPSSSCGDTAVWMYWCMGLVYLWCHFLVHTRYLPKSYLMKAIRHNHMQHHLKSTPLPPPQ